jgi:hypothetical protein
MELLIIIMGFACFEFYPFILSHCCKTMSQRPEEQEQLLTPQKPLPTPLSNTKQRLKISSLVSSPKLLSKNGPLFRQRKGPAADSNASFCSLGTTGTLRDSSNDFTNNVDNIVEVQSASSRCNNLNNIAAVSEPSLRSAHLFNAIDNNPSESNFKDDDLEYKTELEEDALDLTIFDPESVDLMGDIVKSLKDELKMAKEKADSSIQSIMSSFDWSSNGMYFLLRSVDKN